MTQDERRAVYEDLLTTSADGLLKYGEKSTLATQYGCSIQTITRIWNRGRNSLVERSPADVRSRMDKTGRLKKDHDLMKEKIASVDFKYHLNLRC